MKNRPPEKLVDRIIYWLGIYAGIGLFDIITTYDKCRAWIREKLRPKHRHLN